MKKPTRKELEARIETARRLIYETTTADPAIERAYAVLSEGIDVPPDTPSETKPRDDTFKLLSACILLLLAPTDERFAAVGMDLIAEIREAKQ